MKARLIYNRELSKGYYQMRLQCSEVAREAQPGTFLTLRVSDSYQPLLRRPFTIYRYDPEGGTVDIVYKVVGVGTWLMSEMREGHRLDVLGPLGNGFTIPEDEQKFMLVAGGTGVTALYALAQNVSTRKRDAQITLLMGGAEAQDIICIDDFRELGARVLTATEDGSMGETGLVTDLLRAELQGPPRVGDFALYSCGPREMLKEVARLAELHSLPCTVSLEERMGCGMGACLGCVIRVKPESGDIEAAPVPRYKRVCRDGPVFDASEIDWDTL